MGVSSLAGAPRGHLSTGPMIASRARPGGPGRAATCGRPAGLRRPDRYRPGWCLSAWSVPARAARPSGTAPAGR